MLFVLAAMALLSQITLVVNRYVGSNLQSSLSSEATITAAGLAQSMLREVGMKAFDENTLAGLVTDPDSLTSVGSLGPDPGETFPNFDDLDDFDQYERTVTTPRLGDFRVGAQVWYLEDSDLDNSAASQTFLKRVTVTVDQDPSLEYAITVTRVVPY